MKLNEISDKPGARKGRLRVGRGIGSGRGKTAGRGVKGQKSRSGVALKGFEGGQMPLHRRLPKRGFNNYTRKRYVEVGLDTLQKAVDSKRIDAAKPVTGEALKAAGVITHLRDGVRVLGNGEIKAKLTLEVAGATKSAIAAIEAAGGSVTVTAPGPAPESGAEQAPASAGAEAPAAATPEETGDEAKPEGDDA